MLNPNLRSDLLSDHSRHTSLYVRHPLIDVPRVTYYNMKKVYVTKFEQSAHTEGIILTNLALVELFFVYH